MLHDPPPLQVRLGLARALLSEEGGTLPIRLISAGGDRVRLCFGTGTATAYAATPGGSIDRIEVQEGIGEAALPRRGNRPLVLAVCVGGRFARLRV